MFLKKPKYFYTKCFLAKLLLPFSWLYICIFFILKRKIFKGKEICKKVICIGNIVVGGSGKTPVALALGTFLSKNYNICYITKGYGRKESKTLVVPKQHQNLFNATEIGDEALLLSKKADVFVVNKRSKAKCKQYDVAICDDGFFDNTIKKNCQIVVFDSVFFVGNEYVLPAGPLRFSAKSLSKADFVIITDIDDINTYNIKKQILFLEEYIHKEQILFTKVEIKSKHDKDCKYVAFSGIGENSKFFNTLTKSNFNVVGTCKFPDHTVYTTKKLQLIQNIMKEKQANKLITTSKDFVKLPQDFIIQNNVEVLEIEHKIIGLDKILNFLNL